MSTFQCTPQFTDISQCIRSHSSVLGSIHETWRAAWGQAALMSKARWQWALITDSSCQGHQASCCLEWLVPTWRITAAGSSSGALGYLSLQHYKLKRTHEIHWMENISEDLFNSFNCSQFFIISKSSFFLFCHIII